jgi:hypothetical protein
MRRSIGLTAALTALLAGCDPVVPSETVHVTETLSYTIVVDP